MSEIIHTSHASFQFGSSYCLTHQHIEQLITFFNAPLKNVDATLGGRTSVLTVDLDGIGPVLVKPYLRGGVVRFFVKRTYLKIGKPRCRNEYEQLEKARQLGICVPEPIAYAFQNKICYKAWLVTRKIKDQQSLAQLSCTDAKRTQIALKKVVTQVSSLIQHRIYHVDLHPGNILVDKSNAVFIIDFDKAGHFKGSEDRLRIKYLKRWKRAVIKYQLPKILIETMQNGLYLE